MLLVVEMWSKAGPYLPTNMGPLWLWSRSHPSGFIISLIRVPCINGTTDITHHNSSMDGWTRQGTRNQRKLVYGQTRAELASHYAVLKPELIALAKRAKHFYNFYYSIYFFEHLFVFISFGFGPWAWVCSWIQNPLKSATITNKHKVITPRPIRRTFIFKK